MNAAALPVSPSEFLEVVQAHLDERATEDQQSLLESHPKAWSAALLRLLDETSIAIDRVNQRLQGAERSMVVADFEQERRRIDDVLTALIGPARSSNGSKAPEPVDDAISDGTVQLQISWTPGRVVAWAAGYRADASDEPELLKMLESMGADSIGWETYNPVKIPNQGRAPSVSAPIRACLGWLVAQRAAVEVDHAGASVAWMGHLTALAVRLATQGRVVPQLKKARRTSATPKGDDGTTPFEVRWGPALVDSDEHEALATSLPGAVGVIESRAQPIGRTGTTAGGVNQGRRG